MLLVIFRVGLQVIHVEDVANLSTRGVVPVAPLIHAEGSLEEQDSLIEATIDFDRSGCHHTLIVVKVEDCPPRLHLFPHE